MRVKLKVLPYEERLCILCKDNCTISDLKARVFHAIQFYSAYADYLSYCQIHLEIEISDASYGIPDHYLLKDCVTASDVFVVSFVDNQHLTNRQSIHVRFQTQSDIQKRRAMLNAQSSPDFTALNNAANHKNQKNQQHQQHQARHAASQQSQKKHAGNRGRDQTQTVNGHSNASMRDIRAWIDSFISGHGSVRQMCQFPYKEFTAQIEQRFPLLMQTLMASKQAPNWQTFLTQTCHVCIVQTSMGWMLQWDAGAKKVKGQQPQSQPQSRQPRAHPAPPHRPCPAPGLKVQMRAVDREVKPTKPPLSAMNVHIPKEQSGQGQAQWQRRSKGKRKDKNAPKISPSELPTTPESPVSDNDNDLHALRSSPPANALSDEEKKGELKEKETEAEAEYVPDEIVDEPLETVDVEQQRIEREQRAATQSVTELLPEILIECYQTLRANNADCRYVVLHELERAVKNKFRSSTPFELDLAELDYVNFRQMLTLHFKLMRIAVIACDKRLMCTRTRTAYTNPYSPKDAKKLHLEVETYVAIGDIESEIESESANYRDIDLQIAASIAQLQKCCVVQRMSGDNVFFHLKLLHSECSLRTLEAEMNGHSNGLGFQHGIAHAGYNSFDEMASELRDNNVGGAAILTMRWSDWELLHELDRFDRDHQDFVDDIVMDFFFPFRTAEALCRHLSNMRAKTDRERGANRETSSSLLSEEQLRSKMTLCVDYAMFAPAPSAPILHRLVKLMDAEDMDRVLRLHKHVSVDEVVGEWSAMHIAAWRAKFKVLEVLTKYGGDPLKRNVKGETAFDAGDKFPAKLKWFYRQFPKYSPHAQ